MTLESDKVAEAIDYPVLLNAGFEALTKISVYGTSVSWEETDALKITAVASDGEAKAAELSVYEIVDSHNAAFSGYVNMFSAPSDCYFTYPKGLASVVNAATGDISMYYNIQSGRHEPFLYAKTSYSESGINATMNHVGAMLEITVNIDGVTQLTFAGNRLEKLSPMIIDPESGEVSASTEANVQITVPVQTEGKTYIAVPPVNFSKGFSIICSNDDATLNNIKTFSTDGSLAGGYDFSECVGHIIPITLSGSLDNFSVSCSTPAVQHTKNSTGLLTGTSVSFIMSKQGSSDKLIEEWGATLLNSKGQVVREIAYTNANPITGTEVLMNISNNWKLLPAGTYTFAPYYSIYGQKCSLPSQVITVEDPGISLTINGSTSYDKYLAGDISGANSHKNTLISSVSVSANVDLSIVDSYYATFDGVDMGNATITSDSRLTASYGDLTRMAFRSYPMVVTMGIGAITVSAERTFDVTGLPMEADFTASNPTTWSPSWLLINVSYKSNRLSYSLGQSTAKSPNFHIPSDVVVKSYADVKTNITDDSGDYIYIASCTATESSVQIGSVTAAIEYQAALTDGALDSVGYVAASDNITLTHAKPALMFSTNTSSTLGYLTGNILVAFRYKIEYAN